MRTSVWKNRYVITLLLIVGLFYLALQIIAILSSKSSSVDLNEESVVLNRNQFFSDVRTYVTIALCLLGSFLLARRSRLGWILAVSILFLFSVVAGAGLVLMINIGDSTAMSVIIGVILLIMLSGVVLLFTPSMKEMHHVNKTAIIISVFVCAAMSAFYFFLQ